MVHFREHRWLPVNGQSRFSAFISTDDRTREDVLWSLDLHYVAGGAVWRRVHSWERPSLWVGLTGYHPGTRHWTDLERACFWEFESDEDEMLWGRGGGVDVQYDPRQAPQDVQRSFINDHIWRVAARLICHTLSGYSISRTKIYPFSPYGKYFLENFDLCWQDLSRQFMEGKIFLSVKK